MATSVPTCPACHEVCSTTDQFCESCGAPLTAEAATSASDTAASDTAIADTAASNSAELAGSELPGQLAETTDITKPPAKIAEPDTGDLLVGAAAVCPSCGGSLDADRWCLDCGLRGPTPRDHMIEQPAPNIASVCDRGIKHLRNEDACALASVDGRSVLVVCDGVTTTTDSDAASLAAARAARDLLAAATPPDSPSPAARVQYWSQQVALSALAAQDAAVAAAAEVGAAQPVPVEGAALDTPPSCTFVAAVVDGPLVVTGWLGDSRAYWFGDDGSACQLSVDDSWATEQISQGVDRAIAEADSRAHSITRWLGVDAPDTAATTASLTLTQNGWVLVCSDGLWNYCSDATDLRDLLRATCDEHDQDPLETASALVDWANAQGGHDNITAALARVE